MAKVTHRCELASLTKDQVNCDEDLKSTVVIREVASTYCLYSCAIYIQQEMGIEG